MADPVGETEQQRSGGALGGLGGAIGGITQKLGGSSAGSDAGDDQVPEEYKALAAEQRKKGAEGIDPLAENSTDDEIAEKLSAIIQRGLDRIEPFLDMMNTELDALNKKREQKQTIDEQAFVDRMKPLIEKASSILNETLGGMEAADPGGKLRSKARYKKEQHEASPAENHLAELVAKLTGDVAKAIDKCKQAIKDLPKAKKDLGPLLNVLKDPIFQIVAAVGLLLKGVLTLVANILSTLHLDGLVNGLLGGLGINKLLDLIGIGHIFEVSGSGDQKGGKSS